jgi:NitT/TauT family transport system substrate-binding protein
MRQLIRFRLRWQRATRSATICFFLEVNKLLMNRIFTLLTFGIALILFAIAVGNGAASAAELVRFMDIPGPGNLLVRVAISNGYCDKYGIRCELQMIPTAPLGVQAMIAKSIDSAIAPADVIIGAIKNGTNVKMVTGALDSNLLELVVSNDLATNIGNNKWPQFMNDLKGKRIGVTARGASTETAIRFMMSKAGMNPDDATFIAVGGAVTAYNALQSKQIDAVMIVEPVGSICETMKTCRLIWRGSEDRMPAELYGLNGASNGLIFTQDQIEKRPDVIAAVIKLTKDATAFINNPKNFDRVVQIADSYFKFELPKGDEIMRANVAQFIKDRTYVASINRKSVKDTIDYLVAAKLLDAPVSVRELIYDKAP